MYMVFCSNTHLHILCLKYLWSPEEGLGSSRTDFTDGYEQHVSAAD